MKRFNFKKMIASLMAAVSLMTVLTACGGSKNEGKDLINVASLKGPTTMGMIKLVKDDDLKDEADKKYDVSLYATADEIVAGIVQGKIDIANVPCNLASVLYNREDVDITVAAINTLGVLYMVESGNSITTVEDLRGKTIYTTGKGTTTENVLNYVLTKNGIDPEKDVTVEYKSESAEVAQLLSSGENIIAMLPQPYVTVVQSKNDKVKIALDMTEEWDKVGGEDKSALVTGVVIVRNEFLKNNKEAFNKFLDEFKASSEYVKNNVDEAAKYIGEYGIVDEAVAKVALPLCNITFIEGEEMKEKINGYLNVLFSQNPKSVGGKLPEADFYYDR